MTDDLQSLDVVPRLFPLILGGAKTATIRWREIRVVPGPLRFRCGEDSVIVQVTRCTDMPLHAAASYLGRSADWPDAVMLAGMREHYPAITLADVVQVVEFLPPGGGTC